MPSTGSAQLDLANLCLAQGGQTAFLCTNDPNTKTPGNASCIAAALLASGNNAAHVSYHDNAQFYPEVSIAALMLGVDYALNNSTLTAKFKDLPGIDPVNLPLGQTDLNAILALQCNTFILVGNGSRTYREGVQSEISWFTDTRINLDNFVNDLQTAVFNVFLAAPKVPYTQHGQNMLCAAAAQICQQYTDNGTFADRVINDPTATNGFTVAQATTVTPMPIQSASASDRARRLAPPIQIVAYLAGAIHRVVVAVQVTQ